MAVQETRHRTRWEARKAPEEVDLKKRELEQLGCRLAAAARRTGSSDAGATA
jgi:hypothetical protein